MVNTLILTILEALNFHFVNFRYLCKSNISKKKYILEPLKRSKANMKNIISKNILKFLYCVRHSLNI